MNRYFYKGLRFKMTLLFCVIFLVINFIFGRIIYHYFRNGYIDNYNKSLFNRAQTLIEKTEINPNVIALPDSGESIRVFYHDNSGEAVTMFQSPGSIAKLEVPYHKGLVDSLELYAVYLKKDNYDGRPVELLLAVSNLSLNKKLSQFSFLMIGLTLISALVSFLSAYFASGWLLKPIRSIASQAAGINTNKLGQRIRSSDTHDELQQLTQTINGMIGRIEEEQQARNHFFAAASHELRTPLANLSAQTELELKSKTAQTDVNLLNSQLLEITRLQSIVEQFLLISEFENSGILLRRSQTDISDQLLRVFSRNALEASSRGIKPNIHFNEDVKSFVISADAEKLEVVWQNLLQNALKYAPKESIIECWVEQHGAGLKLGLENSILLEKVDVSELGQPFSKGRSVKSGSGLGLWLCKEIINAHHGVVNIESKDHLFRVTVTLPNWII